MKQCVMVGVNGQLCLFGVFYFNIFLESYMFGNVFSGIFGGRVVLGGIIVVLVVYFQVEIGGCFFLGVNCLGVIVLKELCFYGIFREIIIFFNVYQVVIFGNYLFILNSLFFYCGLVNILFKDVFLCNFFNIYFVDCFG